MTSRLLLDGELEFEAREDFVSAARREINSADNVELECKTVRSVGDAVLGMLVALARAAQRRGGRVALVHAPRSLRAQLTAAGVAHFFDWKR